MEEYDGKVLEWQQKTSCYHYYPAHPHCWTRTKNIYFDLKTKSEDP